MVVVELEEVVGLEELVVELEERERDLSVEAIAVGLDRDHSVDREVTADIAEKLDVVEPAQPVAVVEEERVVLLAGVPVEERPELAKDRLAVGGDLLRGEDLAHLGLARGIADHRRAAPEDRDRSVTVLLQEAHRHQLDERARVQRRGGRVEADVEGDHAGRQGVVDGLDVRDLLEIAALDQRLEGRGLRLVGGGRGSHGPEDRTIRSDGRPTRSGLGGIRRRGRPDARLCWLRQVAHVRGEGRL